MGITRQAECDRCHDTKPAYESHNHPMPVGWAKAEVSLRGAHKNEIVVEEKIFCDTCYPLILSFMAGK